MGGRGFLVEVVEVDGGVLVGFCHPPLLASLCFDVS
jgi:hypothetical protein